MTKKTIDLINVLQRQMQEHEKFYKAVRDIDRTTSALRDSLDIANQVSSTFTAIDNNMKAIYESLDRSKITRDKFDSLRSIMLIEKNPSLIEFFETSERFNKILTNAPLEPIDLNKVRLDKLIQIEQSIPTNLQYEKPELEAAEESAIRTMSESGYFDEDNTKEEVINETIDRTADKSILQKYITNKVLVFHLAIGLYVALDLQNNMGISLGDFMAYLLGLEEMSRGQEPNSTNEEK